MNKFYKRVIGKTEEQKAKDEEKERRESPLSQKEYERLFPKLRLQAKNRLRRRSR